MPKYHYDIQVPVFLRPAQETSNARTRGEVPPPAALGRYLTSPLRCNATTKLNHPRGWGGKPRVFYEDSRDAEWIKPQGLEADCFRPSPTRRIARAYVAFAKSKDNFYARRPAAQAAGTSRDRRQY